MLANNLFSTNTQAAIAALCFGALLASLFEQFSIIVLTVVLCMTAFQPLFSGHANVTYSTRAFMLIMGICGSAWVLYHQHQAESEAVPFDQAPYQTQRVGVIENVRSRQDEPRTIVGFDFYTLSASGNSTIKLNVSCYGCDQSFNDGQRWRLLLKIKPFQSFRNAGGFDYRAWMLSQGYAGSAYVIKPSDSEQNTYLNASNAHAIASSLGGIRSQLRSKLDGMSGGSLLQALLLGEKDNLTADEKRLLMRTGTGHLFVVSGLHIGLCVLIFSFIGRFIFRAVVLLNFSQVHGMALFFGLIAGFLYAGLTGFEVPATRALLMIALGAVVWRGALSPVILYWAYALLCVLILSPLSFTQMGPWLSFGIVFILIVGFWGAVSNQKIRVLLKSQWYAFLVGGVILIYFGQAIAPLGLVLNLFLIPLFSLLVMPVSLIGTLMSYVDVDYLLKGLGWLLQTGTNGMLEHTEILGFQLPVHQQNRALWMVIMCLLLIPITNSIKILALLLGCIAFLVPAARPQNSEVWVSILDVGQGNAAIVRTQHHTMLVDTGRPFSSGMSMSDFVVMPQLRAMGVERLDLVLISHSDSDHAGGLDTLQHWGPDIVKVTTQDACNSTQWQWDGVNFEQVQAADYKDGNNGSCILRISNDESSILMPGDIEKKAEKSLLKSGLIAQSDVLLVPHHGSKTSSSSAFLEVVSPKVAIVSAGRFNGYGHPHIEITQRYEDLGIAILGTHSHGAIEVEISPRHEGVKVSPYAAVSGISN